MLNENASIKKQITKVEQDRATSRGRVPRSANTGGEVGDAIQIKQMNTQLQKRIEFLQKREKDLLEHLIKVKKDKAAT